jgi:ABC-type transport system involved in Fe-S cluster assembly fused permease/ATPase subunit
MSIKWKYTSTCINVLLRIRHGVQLIGFINRVLVYKIMTMLIDIFIIVQVVYFASIRLLHTLIFRTLHLYADIDYIGIQNTLYSVVTSNAYSELMKCLTIHGYLI